MGSGVVNSLFAGMDSTYEPPRAIKVPKEFGDILGRFQNVYLRFSTRPVSREDLRSGRAEFRDHPLGFLFNGPATPVNTRELAIATPVATQDVEGVSVSRRPAFGINLGVDIKQSTKTLTLIGPRLIWLFMIPGIIIFNGIRRPGPSLYPILAGRDAATAILCSCMAQNTGIPDMSTAK